MRLPAASPRPARILVVEDEGLVAVVMQRQLQAEGFDVPDPVASGEAAITAARSLAPDLILMDVQLAGAMDGIEAARAIHAELDVPVIYLTAFSEDEHMRRAEATDPYAYLVKPVHPRELRAAIDTSLYRHRVNKRLRGSEARFRAIVESTPVPLVITRVNDGLILYANDRAAETFGYAASELVGRPSPDFYADPSQREHLLGLLRRDGRLKDQEVVFRRPDGSTTVTLVSGAVADFMGEPAVFSGMVVIDERVAAQAAVAASEQQMRLALDAAQLGTWRHDVKTDVLEADALAQRHFGIHGPRTTFAELMARTDPLDAARVHESVETALQPGENKPGRNVFEARVHDGEGNTRWLAVHGQVPSPRNAAEAPAYTIGTTQDITERKQTEETLRRVLSGSPSVIYALAVTPDGLRSVWVSENVQALTGWTTREALGPSWWRNNLHPDDRDRVLASQANLTDMDRQVIQFRFRRKDAGWIWIQDERNLHRDASGRPTEVVGSWSDVTERMALEDQFRQAQKMEAVGRLAGGVAHDFNNLLTVISGNGDLVAMELDADHPARKLVDEMRDAAGRAAALTRQLLAFSRTQVLSPRVLDINEVVMGLSNMLHRLIGEDIRVSTVLSPDVGRVRVDPVQLEQVIINLAVNARDAMPTGGRLSLETRDVDLSPAFLHRHPDARAGRHTLLSVTDTGCGMDATVIAHIFEPFFTTKPAGQGTGLGLAMVFGIIKQSEGHIEVDSTPGKGTRFDIYLPVALQADIAAEHAAGAIQPNRGNETILVVEDDEAVRRVTSIIMERQGYRVLLAEDGMQALALARETKGPIHLLLTDVVMPGMDGHQLAEQVKAVSPSIRVIFLSGYVDDAVVRHGIVKDNVAFLGKPFTPVALARKVRDVLDGKG